MHETELKNCSWTSELMNKQNFQNQATETAKSNHEYKLKNTHNNDKLV